MLLGEIAGQNDHLILGHLLGLDHHADLTAGLNGVALLDAGIGARDLLELLQTLDVVLQVLTARAGTRGGDGVGRLHQAGHQRLALHVAVVRLNGVDDVLLLAVLAGVFHTERHVRALDLVVKRLADVVQQTRALGGL